MLSVAQKQVLGRAVTGRLIISQPGGFHVPYAPAYWEVDNTIVNGKVLKNLLAHGFLDTQSDSHFNTTLTHEITEKGAAILRQATTA